MTPLHLAVISGNTKIVRKLLMKGGDRQIEDKNEKTPMDIATDNNYVNIMAMLEETKSLA